jgi:hypothetical protein
LDIRNIEEHWNYKVKGSKDEIDYKRNNYGALLTEVAGHVFEKINLPKGLKENCIRVILYNGMEDK